VKRSAAGEQVILLRRETSPEDVDGMHHAEGILTSTGGMTSHAAVVAHRLGKTCVVGCGELLCDENSKSCTFNQIKVKTGDHISIDGHEGSVFRGMIKVKEA
jgi:pyruvate,orthophosphate dikinase